MAAPVKECKVYFSPVQEGEGDPSPENVRAIGGWTGIEVYRTGKNLMPPTQLESNWKWSKVFIKGGTKVTCSSITPQTGNDQVTFYQKDKITKIDYWTLIQRYQDGTRGYRSFTVQNGGVPYDAVWWKFPYGDDAQLELGTTPTDYEPYQGQTLPIDWTTEAGTVYGGYVDLVTGEVVQEYELTADTWGNIKYSSINSTTGYQYGRLFFKNPVVKAGMSNVSKVSYCNVGQYSWNLTSNATPHFYIDTMGGAETYTAYITLPSTTDDNLLITCAGKLITPIIYSLTPQQLKTLRGINNIWSNANGNIELSYWKH